MTVVAYILQHIKKWQLHLAFFIIKFKYYPQYISENKE